MKPVVIRVIREVLIVSRRVIALANECEGATDDDSCLRLSAELRDCGYHLHRAATYERLMQIAAGSWVGEDAAGPTEEVPPAC